MTTALARRHRLAREIRRIDPLRPVGRKTTRTRKVWNAETAKTETWEKPDIRVVFMVPPQILVAPGAHGFDTEVSKLNTVTITRKTWNREEVFERAAAFLRKVVPKGLPPLSVVCVMTSSSEPGWSDKWWLALVDGHAVVNKSPIGPLIFPAPPN